MKFSGEHSCLKSKHVSCSVCYDGKPEKFMFNFPIRKDPQYRENYFLARCFTCSISLVTTSLLKRLLKPSGKLYKFDLNVNQNVALKKNGHGFKLGSVIGSFALLWAR